jgi:hypothetical protein
MSAFIGFLLIINDITNKFSSIMYVLKQCFVDVNMDNYYTLAEIKPKLDIISV